tara:strand:- start:410 stop:646 length:237 start_codon:yes stop_codon:yes gene_type:complete
METHYYNAYHNSEEFFIESKSLTYDEAMQEPINYPHLNYAYTIEVGLESCRRFDIEVKRFFPDEKTTGHEHGTNPGRV